MFKIVFVPNTWSTPTVILSVLGALGMLALAAATQAVMIPGIFAAALFLVLGIYLAAPRRSDSTKTASNLEESAPPGIPDAAKVLLNSLDEPIIIFDVAGKVLIANSSSRALVGSDSERKHISAVLRYPEILEGAARVLAGGDAETIFFSVVVPVERHYRARITPIESDGPGLLMLQLSDLTSTRRAEELRADFIANASHELRTPLAAVSGFVDTLLGHAKDDAAARQRFLEIMSVETTRMRRLIDDLLSLSQIELNEHNPPMGKVDLVMIVRGAAAALAPLADIDNVNLEIADSDPLWAIGDRDELIQVFQNLIHNAIKYGGESRKVHLGFGTSPGAGRNVSDRVFASVHDEGEGIPREAIPRLTERFYRVDVKRSRARGGTGLGLAIVKHILNRHNGKLQIESVLGEGSTFTVALPAAMTILNEAEEVAIPEIPRAT
jgi:two-component system phosphate regulon sensor histidine kinase PhoR